MDLASRLDDLYAEIPWAFPAVYTQEESLPEAYRGRAAFQVSKAIGHPSQKRRPPPTAYPEPAVHEGVPAEDPSPSAE